MENQYSLILAECSAGQPKKGVEMGPSYLQKLFPQCILRQQIYQTEFDQQYGYQKLYDIHYDLMKQNIIPITLGGDHSIGHITVGSSVQKYKDDLMILWIDAHADINTLEASKSKNTHGTPLSGLIGLEQPWIPNIKHLLKPHNLIYYGIRDLDDYEKDVLNKYDIQVIKTTDDLIKLIPNYNNVHISFDVDSLDGQFVDSTGTIAPNGLHPKDVVKCFKICKEKLRAIDIVEFNPHLGNINNSMATMNYIIENIL